MSIEELLTYVIYDIVDDGMRYKVSEVCKDYGLERIQFSASSGFLNRNRRGELRLKLENALGTAQGKILIQPVCEKDRQICEILERVEETKRG